MAQIKFSTELKLMDLENRLVVAKGEREGEEVGWESGVNRCKLLHLEWISNEILLYSPENYIQSLMMERDNVRKKDVYMYV